MRWESGLDTDAGGVPGLGNRSSPYELWGWRMRPNAIKISMLRGALLWEAGKHGHGKGW